MTENRKTLGLAVIGCGTIGRIRAEFARDYPGIGWIGLCDVKEDPLHSPCIVAGLDLIIREHFGCNLEEFWRRRNELLATPNGKTYLCPLARGFSLQPRLREWAQLAGYDADFYICFHSSVRKGFAQSASSNISAAKAKSGPKSRKALHR